MPKRNKILLKLGLFAWLTAICLQPVFSQNTGKNSFLMYCGSCHGIADGAFGPKLGGIHKIRTAENFRNFVNNTTEILKQPDTRNKALLDKYKSPMPAFKNIGKTEIDAIYNYIKTESEKLKIEPLTLASLLVKKTEKRYAPPVKASNLYVELETIVSIPRTSQHLDDKGINTLRSNKYGLYISDQMGQIYHISNKKAELYFDIQKLLPDFIIFPSIGAGLGSFAFHPDFEKNGLLYTTHNEKYIGKPAINEGDWPDSLGTEQQYVLDEWQTETPGTFPFKLNKHREVLRINTPTYAHSGQDLMFAPLLPKTNPDYGMLYYGFGDGGTANIKKPQYAHNIHSLLGCILRIDPLGNNGIMGSYGIPATNPFANNPDPKVQKEIYAYGFRNPYRFAWDIARGHNMYVGDIGEANVEELNLVKPGADYGWASQEGIYGIDVTVDKTVLFDRPDRGRNSSILPVLTYDHTDGFAISGGHIYRGPLKALAHKYVFGDIVNGRLFFAHAGNFAKGVYDLNIAANAKETNMQELAGAKRTHMRIGYDYATGQLYTLTKPDNTLRRIAKAYFR
jgi:mono/diheme cytochrome c family protein